MDQAFADNCDVLRQRNARRMEQQLAQEREQQVQQKLAAQRLADEERRLADAMHAAEQRRMEARHQQDVRRQESIAGGVKSSLDAQLAAVRERQAAERQQEAVEVARMQQHWAQLQAEVEAAERAESQRLHALADDVRRFNELKLLQLSEAERQERCVVCGGCWVWWFVGIRQQGCAGTLATKAAS